MPNLADVLAARERIRDAVALTPIVPATSLTDSPPAALYLKLESLQRTGSFKDHGALNRLLDLTPREGAGSLPRAPAIMRRGGVSRARLGVPIEVVMPENTPTFLLSIQLSINPDIIRHPKRPTTADHAVRQRFNDFLPDFLLPFSRLISVRSVVQLYPGP